MINLLPPEEKLRLQMGKNRRLAIVLGNVCIISLVCLALVLLACKFYVLAQTTQENASLEISRKQYETDDFLTVLDSMKQYNKMLSTVNNFYRHQNRLADPLILIASMPRGSGLYITNLSLKPLEQGGGVAVVMDGKSSTRQYLQDFKNGLDREPKIKNVDFPSENWVKATDIDFHVSFELTH